MCKAGMKRLRVDGVKYCTEMYNYSFNEAIKKSTQRLEELEDLEVIR